MKKYTLTYSYFHIWVLFNDKYRHLTHWTVPR